MAALCARRPPPPLPLPPSLRTILQLPRGTQSSAFAERRRTLGYSSPSRVIYPRAASRMRRKCENAFAAFALPSPPPKPSPEILPFPAFIAFVDRSARGPHARRAISPHRERYVSGKGQGGGLFNGFLAVPIFVSAFPFQITNAGLCANVYLPVSLRLSLEIDERDWWFRFFERWKENVEVYFFPF